MPANPPSPRLAPGDRVRVEGSAGTVVSTTAEIRLDHRPAATATAHWTTDSGLSAVELLEPLPALAGMAERIREALGATPGLTTLQAAEAVVARAGLLAEQLTSERAMTRRLREQLGAVERDLERARRAGYQAMAVLSPAVPLSPVTSPLELASAAAATIKRLREQLAGAEDCLGRTREVLAEQLTSEQLTSVPDAAREAMTEIKRLRQERDEAASQLSGAEHRAGSSRRELLAVREALGARPAERTIDAVARLRDQCKRAESSAEDSREAESKAHRERLEAIEALAAELEAARRREAAIRKALGATDSATTRQAAEALAAARAFLSRDLQRAHDRESEARAILERALGREHPKRPVEVADLARVAARELEALRGDGLAALVDAALAVAEQLEAAWEVPARDQLPDRGAGLTVAQGIAALRSRMEAAERAASAVVSAAVSAAARGDQLRDEAQARHVDLIDKVRERLGAGVTENVVEAAARVVRERDEARGGKEIAPLLAVHEALGALPGESTVEAAERVMTSAAERGKEIAALQAIAHEVRTALGAGDDSLAEAAVRVVWERDEAQAGRAFARDLIDKVRATLGAAGSCESTIEVARRVVTERDDARGFADSRVAALRSARSQLHVLEHAAGVVRKSEGALVRDKVTGEVCRVVGLDPECRHGHTIRLGGVAPEGVVPEDDLLAAWEAHGWRKPTQIEPVGPARVGDRVRTPGGREGVVDTVSVFCGPGRIARIVDPGAFLCPLGSLVVLTTTPEESEASLS